MAHKGQFKTPKLSLNDAVDRAMKFIDHYQEGCAVFIIGGKICASKRNGAGFDSRTKTLLGNLVGVYDDGVDARRLREDIEVFYRRGG